MIKSEDDDTSRLSSNIKAYIKYFNLILQMVLIVLIGAWGGVKLDKWIQSEHHLFTIIFILSACALAVFYLFRTLLKK